MLRQLNQTIRLEVSFIVAEHNYTEISALGQLLQRIPVDFLLVKYSRFASDNRWITSEKLQAIRSQIDICRSQIPTYYRDPVLVENVGFPIQKCRTTYLKAVLAPNGNLYICNQRRSEAKMAIGSLYEKRFWDIWGSEKHKAIYTSINTEECTPCRHIEYNRLLYSVESSVIPAVEVSEGVGTLASFL